jgi:lipopolysaccharide biosynthesis glycosyltransferase
MPETKDAVHVALAVYDPKGTYSRHAGVVMASIFENTESPVHVHILHDRTLTERNRSLLSETADKYAQKIEFHDVSLHVKRAKGTNIEKALRSWPIGALFRLLIPEILSVDKVIYLDSDLVVNMDICELWNVSLEGCSLAGALERPKKPFSLFSRKTITFYIMGCDRKNYINSGILLINIPKIRKKYRELFSEGVIWLERYRYCEDAIDQDFLNSRFRGDIKIIDGRFNNRDSHIAENNVSGKILHMALVKPWEIMSFSPIDHLYWKFFFKTPFGELKNYEIIDMITENINGSPFIHRHTSQCWKRIWIRFWHYVIWNEAVILVWFCLREVLFKAKKLFAKRSVEP